MQIISLQPFGAEIRDIDLAVPLDIVESLALSAALDEHSVLVFRDQHMSDADHVRVVGGMIPGSVPSTDVADDVNQFTILTNDGAVKEGASSLEDTRLTFHADYSFTTEPDKIVSLYGYEVEEGASPTEFASGKLGLKLLPAELRSRLEGLNVINAVRIDAQEARLPNYALPGRDDLTGVAPTEVFRARWPAVRRHPRTGAPLLFINEQHSHHFEGVPIAQSHRLLEQAFDVLYSDATIYRHSWRNGDLVIWDNIATTHGRRATPLMKARRTLRRVKIGRAKFFPAEHLMEFSQPELV